MKQKIEDYILFENEDFIVINKPSGIATLDERKDVFAPAILRMAKEYSSDAQVGHRLDKETTGALIIAKNPESYRHISMQFEHRETAKRYHAVVEGMHNWDGMLVNLPILPLKDGKVIIDRNKGESRHQVGDVLFETVANDVPCHPVTNKGVNRFSRELEASWYQRSLPRTKEKESHHHDCRNNRCNQGFGQPRKGSVRKVRIKVELANAWRNESFASSDNRGVH